MTDNSGKKVVRVPCIDYPVQFYEKQVRALLDSSSKVNVINPAFAWKLDLHIRKTNVGDHKIDGSALETFEMVIADFQMEDKGGKPRFF